MARLLFAKHLGSLRPVDQAGEDALSKEIWRTAVGFEAYEVSNYGNVRRAKTCRGGRVGHILRANLDSRGYPMVTLMRDGVRHGRKVHRLVAEAFLGPRPSIKHEVAHYDGTRNNNNLENLRWATSAENKADRIRHGTANRGERHGLAVLTSETVSIARKRRASGQTIKSIANELNVAYGTLRNALGGYSWQWLND